MKKMFLMFAVVVALFCFADDAFAADGIANVGKGRFPDYTEPAEEPDLFE